MAEIATWLGEEIGVFDGDCDVCDILDLGDTIVFQDWWVILPQRQEPVMPFLNSEMSWVFGSPVNGFLGWSAILDCGI